MFCQWRVALSRSFLALGALAGDADSILAARAAQLQAIAGLFARDRVLSVASHDLRSPLNGIHSWIYVLESKLGQADPTVQRALAGLRTGVEQQVRIIEDVIDATRAQTRALPLAKTMLEIEPVVDEVVRLLRATFAGERATNLDVTWPGARVSIDADLQRIVQGLWAALAYAVDASRPGSSVALDNAFADGAWQATIRFRASEALADPNLPHAFEPFLRAPTAVQGRDGVPLALAVTQRVADAHGGKLSASEGGDGVTLFVLTLPQSA
jgi:signal transduction histidine kinase